MKETEREAGGLCASRTLQSRRRVSVDAIRALAFDWGLNHANEYGVDECEKEERAAGEGT